METKEYNTKEGDIEKKASVLYIFNTRILLCVSATFSEAVFSPRGGTCVVFAFSTHARSPS